MAVLPKVTAVLLLQSGMNAWTGCCIVSTDREEMADLPAVTAVLLLHSAIIYGLNALLIKQDRG